MRGRALNTTVPATLALVTLICGCNDLTVDLDDDDKQGLATFVENDGRYPALPTPIDVPDTTRLPSLDHLAWDATVRRYVTDEGRVRYDELNNHPDSVEALDNYLELIGGIDTSALRDDDERLAFWLNAYNAITFRAVAAEIASDPEFRVDRDAFAFFDVDRAAGGHVLSLNMIEHGVIRGDMSHPAVSGANAETQAAIVTEHERIFGSAGTDSRIHVGLNCASVSCPLLPEEAFVADRVDAQLDALSAAFVLDPLRGAGPDGISMLFLWYGVDFDATHGGAEGFVGAYRDDVSSVDFATYLPYDWALNAAETSE